MIITMVAFLESLTGTVPDISYPILPAETATTPRPTAELEPNFGN